jgi:hypothetical protein
LAECPFFGAKRTSDETAACFGPTLLTHIVALVAAITLRAIDRTTARQAWTCRLSKDNRWG